VPAPTSLVPELVTETLHSTGRAGIYVHFPWCLRHCPYCDFAVAVNRTIPHEGYARAVVAELNQRLHELHGAAIQTLYFGGGTPGLWDPAWLGHVIDAVRARGVCLREVTVEVNPESFDITRAEALAAHGVNRVSLGVQSMNTAALRTLGREHGPEQVVEAVAALRKSGIARVSVDLIYGVPDTNIQDVMCDIDALAALEGVEHLSAYELTWEAGTGFDRRRNRGLMAPWEEQRLVELSAAVVERLASHGFERYEVSSFARPGGRAVHNSAYWIGDAYLGLGVGAHSLQVDTGAQQAIRRANPRAVRDYMPDAGAATRTVECVSAHEHLGELMMTGLRTSDALAPVELQRRFGGNTAHWLDTILAGWEAHDWVRRRGDAVLVTEAGMLQADTMASDVFALLPSMDE
jgi:oxygen-independent coproporphyrinogen III oxidase